MLLAFLTVATGGLSRASAQSEGPNAPATVVNDPSFGTEPWVSPQNAAISDDTYAFGFSGSLVVVTQYHGITKVLLKGSTHDKAKSLRMRVDFSAVRQSPARLLSYSQPLTGSQESCVHGLGAGLADLDLTDLVEPVTVQLVNDTTSVCFESTFDQADFIEFDDPAEFRAKSQ